MKSYPLSYIEKNQFDRLTRWLDGFTVYDLSMLDMSKCDSIDDWLDLLDQHTMCGFFIQPHYRQTFVSAARRTGNAPHGKSMGCEIRFRILVSQIAQRRCQRGAVLYCSIVGVAWAITVCSII